jgi:hypothetical protein
MQTFITALEGQFVEMLDRSCLAEAMGGRARAERGLDELRAGILPIVGELIQAHERGTPLARAVYDGERYPHLVRVHGWVADLLDLAVPAHLQTWARRVLSLAPAVGDDDFERLVATVAFRSPSLAERAMGRFALFELLCLEQRLSLLAGHVDVEVIGGRPDHPEVIAEGELAQVEARPEYREALVALEDPLATLRVLLGASVARLDAYVELLRQEVTRVGRDMAGRLQIRQDMLRALAALDPADAVLIKNAHAEAFGVERLTVEQLKARHPGLLATLTPAAARKRLERALKRRPGAAAAARPTTFGDLLLAQMDELPV